VLGGKGHEREGGILIFPILRMKIASEKVNKHVLANPRAFSPNLKEGLNLWRSIVDGGITHCSRVKLTTIHECIEYENMCNQSSQNQSCLRIIDR